MKRMLRAIICISLTLTILVSSVNNNFVFAAEQQSTLSEEQKNAIDMLNYITVLTQDINASQNSRVYLEEAYSSLINNVKGSKVKGATLSQLTGLLDTMEKYRMIAVKRDRLQYIYEQNKAQSMRAAIPNPMGLISAVHSLDPVKLVASVVYMAADSVTSYNAYTTEIERQYLEDGWALDDEEAEALHESRKDSFIYMIKMVDDYQLPDDLTLTEQTTKELVRLKNDDNVVGRIQALESEKETYQAYGGYWLILAESYYENKNYQECLDAIEAYENLGIDIFRKDYDYAKVLPLAIVSAGEIYDRDEYYSYVVDHVKKIIDNTDQDDWALRYFAAQTLVDLYSEIKTKGKDYNEKGKSCLEDAYKIITDNVYSLLREQEAQNKEYLQPIEERVADKKLNKDEANKYKKMLKESRKTELPPIYEPLLLNCELLFAIADEYNISKEERSRIDKLLHPKDDCLFYVKPIDEQFWFDKTKLDTGDTGIKVDESGITMPATMMTNNSPIEMKVLNADGSLVGKYMDWKVDNVDRNTEDDVDSFVAKYSSPTFKKIKWEPGMTVELDIYPDGENSCHYDFNTTPNKNKWYEYLKVWEDGIIFTLAE